MAVLSVLQSGYSLLLLSLLLLSQTATAAVCPNPVAQSIANPVVADGLVAKVIATGLQGPRGIIFDKAGHLLVVEPGKGISALTLKDDGGSCLSVTKKATVVSDSSLNHGIELGPAGGRLYASNVGTVYNWNYNYNTAQIGPNSRRTLITGMTNSDHSTRTLTLSKKNTNMLVVNRGSASNVDNLALQKSSGHAQVKVFDLSKRGNAVYDFTKNGTLLAWGVRNSVGIGEEPVNGGIYTVENSVDNAQRDNQDVHNNNPGEKMNFLGYVSGGKTSPNTGTNFGYPRCFATWDPTKLPNNSTLDTGIQFALQGSGVSDAFCQKNVTAPRITFDAHQAPLDIKFDKAGNGYVSFHGSFNRSPAAGYKVGIVKFKNGSPVAPSNSMTALIELVGNPNVGSCTSSTCFRPVGIAFDSKGRMFFSSDATGEIWAVSRADGKSLYANPTV